VSDGAPHWSRCILAVYTGRRTLLTPRKLEFGITRRGRGRACNCVRTRNTYRRALLVRAQIETRKNYCRGYCSRFMPPCNSQRQHCSNRGGGGIYRSRVTAALTETEKGKHAKGQSKDRSAARARSRIRESHDEKERERERENSYWNYENCSHAVA